MQQAAAIMLRGAIPFVPLRRAFASVVATHCLTFARPVQSIFPSFKALRTRRLCYDRISVLTSSRRCFSSEPPPLSPTLVVSLNCARRIAHLQKQKAAADSRMPRHHSPPFPPLRSDLSLLILCSHRPGPQTEAGC
jgi:hypothetical protein